jgi:hypothetical protein
MDARRGRGCRGPAQGESEDESEAISEGVPAGVPITYLTSSPRHRQRQGRRGPVQHTNTGTVVNVITRGVMNANEARWGLWRGGPCYRPLDPGTSPLRSTGISAARTTQWSWMTPSSGKIGLVLLVYASPDVDGLHESPCDSAPMYVTRSPVSSCPTPCAQYPVPCTL